MTSTEAYNKILCSVNCKYGAPMGRKSDPKYLRPTDQRVFDRKVIMFSCGAYDKGGAYWGIGDELRVEYTADLSYVHFYRKNNNK